MYVESHHRDQGRGNRIAGAVGAAVYLLLIALVVFLVKFTVDAPQHGEGMMINFGTLDEAGGDQDLNMQEAIAPASSAAARSGGDPQEIATQDHQEAPEVAPTNTRRQPQTNPQQTASNTSSQQQNQTPQRTADQRSMFPGMTQGSTSTSEGTGQGQGNQGNPDGSPQGSHEGTGGTGNSGNSFSLSGRSLSSALPVPSYDVNEEGRVVVQIDVNRQGVVTSAKATLTGSTTRNTTLIAAAEKAARQARFNANPDAPFTQTGTITYNFKMR